MNGKIKQIGILAIMAVLIASTALVGTGAAQTTDDSGHIDTTITDENGDPVDAGEVTLINDSDGTTAQTATTDADGYVTFSSVPYGDYSLEWTDDSTNTVSSDVFPHDSNLTSLEADYTTGDIEGVDAPEGGYLQLELVDQNGDRVAERNITLLDSEGNEVGSATTDASGSVTFDSVDAGEYTAEYTYDGDTVETDGIEHEGDTEVSVTLETQTVSDSGFDDYVPTGDDSSGTKYIVGAIGLVAAIAAIRYV